MESGADPNDIYTDEKGKEHNLLFDSVTLGNEVKLFFFRLNFEIKKCRLIGDEVKITGVERDLRSMEGLRGERVCGLLCSVEPVHGLFFKHSVAKSEKRLPTEQPISKDCCDTINTTYDVQLVHEPGAAK